MFLIRNTTETKTTTVANGKKHTHLNQSIVIDKPNSFHTLIAPSLINFSYWNSMLFVERCTNKNAFSFKVFIHFDSCIE